ncbi:uncharacterized protein [Spinacia oleracea]|uniref:Uncharacterized protein n=1 Tax=Spinacia oleracea TaxID=3562 RepID=A0ABM3QS92_SPIOL|nr:uncharacterized protein LOC130461943 [Spinacia oleracea]
MKVVLQSPPPFSPPFHSALLPSLTANATRRITGATSMLGKSKISNKNLKPEDEGQWRRDMEELPRCRFILDLVVVVAQGFEARERRRVLRGERKRSRISPCSQVANFASTVLHRRRFQRLKRRGFEEREGGRRFEKREK